MPTQHVHLSLQSGQSPSSSVFAATCSPSDYLVAEIIDARVELSLDEDKLRESIFECNNSKLCGRARGGPFSACAKEQHMASWLANGPIPEQASLALLPFPSAEPRANRDVFHFCLVASSWPPSTWVFKDAAKLWLAMIASFQVSIQSVAKSDICWMEDGPAEHQFGHQSETTALRM